MIEVKNLTKSFEIHKKAEGFRASVQSLFVRESTTKFALKEVSFEIEKGDIVGFVGANGAGKTTLVKILSGIVHPTSGQARVLGFDPWKRHTDFKKQISIIMGQKAQLWWDLPAADCFVLLREIYQIPEHEHKKILGELVEMLGVGNELHVQIRRLSLGERMKMELIAALLHRPRVVFLDEPTIGLDLTSQRAIRKFLLEYRNEFNPVMILTSHYMEDIESMAKRVMILRQGEFVFDGPLSQILEKYANSKVLSFRVNSDDFSAESFKKDSKLAQGFLSAEDGVFRIKVDRKKVSEYAAHLLAKYPVSDLNIEEEGIANIIESLQTQGL